MKQLPSKGFADAEHWEVSEYLDRVLHSEKFRKAPSLRDLLQYLVAQTLEGHKDRIKENVIALEVFGRADDFDSRIDNIVRVQAHRLRKLLEAYYEHEGKLDKLKIAIPKGCYVPKFEHLSLDEKPEETDSAVAHEEPAGTPATAAGALFSTSPLHSAVSRSRYRLGFVALAGFLAGILLTSFFVWSAWPREATAPVAQTGDLLTPPVSALWKDFLEPGVPTMVAFTNPVFLRSQRSGLYLRYYGPLSAPWGARLNIPASQAYLDSEFVREAGPFFFTDGITFTGELLAVHKLTSLFTQAGFPLHVRRSRSVTLEDLRGANVIFVGSPSGNVLLAKIPFPKAPFSCCENEAITVDDPKPGEPASFEYVRDQATGELTASYGLISVLPGVNPRRTLLVAAGLATQASWGCIDFLTSPVGVTELMRHFEVGPDGSLPRYFQAIIRTEVSNGEASKTSLATARVVSLAQNVAGMN